MAISIFRPKGPRPPRPPIARPRVVIAWMVALSADFLQIVFAPIFGPGFVSFFDDVLDAFVAIVLTVLLGWHWEFLPGFLVKLIPFVDLVPTWTLACWLATRGRTAPPGVSGPRTPTKPGADPPPPEAPPISGARP